MKASDCVFTPPSGASNNNNIKDRIHRNTLLSWPIVTETSYQSINKIYCCNIVDDYCNAKDKETLKRIVTMGYHGKYRLLVDFSATGTSPCIRSIIDDCRKSK